MRSIHLKIVAAADGELRLSNLPVHKGDEVEAIVLMPERVVDERRREARAEFLEHTTSSVFRSSGAYPSREELHERD